MSRGVIYAILSALAFSIQNVIVKELSYTTSTGEIAFFRGFLSALLILGLMRIQHVHLSKRDIPTLTLRGVLGGIGMICIFYALRGMPLADVSIISQLSAFFVMLFAAIFLKEVLPPGSKLPLLVIFIGGCLVVRPWNFSSFNVYSLFALGQAVFAAGAYTTVSKLTVSGRHHPYEVVLYFLVCAALSGIVLMALTDGFVMPAHGDWIYYGGLALFSVIAQIWMTNAYATANPVVVSFVSYIGVFFNALWGFVIFGEILTGLTVAGGVLIIGGSMYLTKLKHDKIAEMARMQERKQKEA